MGKSISRFFTVGLGHQITTQLQSKNTAMKNFVQVIVLFSCMSCLSAQSIPVFVSGSNGYKSYRIPAIICLPNGDLLAFCEGRVNGSSDFGDIDIVMKRSSDKGETWGALQVVTNYSQLQAGNAAPVVDLNDPAYPNGRIFLFYNTGNNSENEIRNGNGLREVWYKTSTDDGYTWSQPVNITVETHRPKQPQIHSTYSFNEDWRSYANTPGHAMQFSAGKYKGRIFIAANHSAGNLQQDFTDYKAHGFYTDDHGKTFHLSEPVNIAGSNESSAAELSNNRLMMNSRNQQGDIKNRIISISSNGGESWDTSYFDKALIDPVCEGSVLTIGEKSKQFIIAFCNDADTLNRNNLTLRIGFDDGKTWLKKYVVDKSDAKTKNYTGYSDLVKISDNQIGVLYERKNYEEINFKIIKWK